MAVLPGEVGGARKLGRRDSLAAQQHHQSIRDLERPQNRRHKRRSRSDPIQQRFRGKPVFDLGQLSVRYRILHCQRELARHLNQEIHFVVGERLALLAI